MLYHTRYPILWWVKKWAYVRFILRELTSLAVAFFCAVLLGLLPLAAAGLLDMRHSLEWFIAVRYLVAKRRQVFISAITAICVVGIAAGVWLIIVVLSVMNGFEKTWRDEMSCPISSRF